MMTKRRTTPLAPAIPPDPFVGAVAALQRPDARAADIEAVLADLRGAAGERAAALEEANQARRAAVLAGDAQATARTEAAIAAARQTEERAAILAEALAERLQIAQEAERDAAAAALYADAAAAAKALESDMRAALAGLHDTASALIARVHDVQNQIEIANARRPAGTDAILDPDLLVRGRPARPEKVIDAAEIEAWCFVGSGRRLSEDQVAKVDISKDNPRVGRLYQLGGGTVVVELRRFVRERYLPRQPAEWPDPIAFALRVPAPDVPADTAPRALQERWTPVADGERSAA